jgi:hypothetical protein
MAKTYRNGRCARNAAIADGCGPRNWAYELMLTRQGEGHQAKPESRKPLFEKGYVDTALPVQSETDDSFHTGPVREARRMELRD